jgi:hypothetical protein
MDDIAQEIYVLVKKKLKEQGAYNRDAYCEIIDETIQYFLEKGKLDPDDNVDLIQTQLEDMWEETEDDLAVPEDKYYNF